MARPTKLTPAVTEKVVRGLQMGLTYRLAAQYAGIHYDTLREWTKQGEADLESENHTAFSEFSDQVKLAEAEAAMNMQTVIQAAALKGDWKAAAWKLERRYPQEYGRNVTEIQGLDGGPIRTSVDLEALSVEDLEAALAIAEKAAGGDNKGAV
jgi:hypothetical protein